MKIKSIKGLQIYDSRGVPTVQVTCELEDGTIAHSKVPSGASTGEHEAVELRDNDKSHHLGKGVLKAVANVNGPLAKLLIGMDAEDQHHIDRKMIELDGTANKGKLGANAILGCSLAVVQAVAKSKNLPLYRHLATDEQFLLPCPMLNIINGGVHADNTLDFQEFMIRPVGANSFKEAMEVSAGVFQHLKKILSKAGHVTSVGDEGGFAPNFKTHEEALDAICESIEAAGFKPKSDVTIALDAAASFMWDKDNSVYIDKKKSLKGQPFESRTSEEQTHYLEQLASKYPIDSIEDGLDENDWEGWSYLTKTLGNKIQIVGDDLFVTNPEFLKKGINQKSANAILIKLNQIGTLTETLETIDLAHANGLHTVISHRSGETEDTFIADLSVATKAGQIKTGSMSRSERIAKYNRLLEIESELDKDCKYNKNS